MSISRWTSTHSSSEPISGAESAARSSSRSARAGALVHVTRSEESGATGRASRAADCEAALAPAKAVLA